MTVNIAIGLIVAAYVFLLGMNYGAYRERKWRLRTEQAEAELRYYQFEVDEVCRQVAAASAEDDQLSVN